jgi:homoserine dehydrogenase
VTARPLRLWIVGFGTVGRWLGGALTERGADLTERYGVRFEVVGVANRSEGFFYRENGIDLRGVRSLGELPDVRHWPMALEGLRATEADVLVEVSESPPPSGEPGRAHLEEALGRGISAVTSNKWPVALHGVELAELARTQAALFHAESTVMSGTPVLRALTEGLAGASPVAVRGVLNATANYIVSEMARGQDYSDALADAQRKGLAERDPSADVDGHDAVAKAMVLSAMVFGRQLRLEDVSRGGISSVTQEAVSRAVSEGRQIREVTTVEGSVARVEPVALASDDPLARIDGTDNAVVCRAEPLGQVMVVGPGAGLELAGQGVLSDLVAIARGSVGRPSGSHPGR